MTVYRRLFSAISARCPVLVRRQSISACRRRDRFVRSDTAITSFAVHPDEQTAIAAVLSDMDAELAALEARRDKTRELKQAMMQELLTGRTRLVPAGGAHA